MPTQTTEQTKHTPGPVLMNVTIKRETDDIYTAVSDVAYWSNGERINERLAWNAGGRLSNAAAQAIDRKNGKHYILVAPFGIHNANVIESVCRLGIGESFTFSR